MGLKDTGAQHQIGAFQAMIAFLFMGGARTDRELIEAQCIGCKKSLSKMPYVVTTCLRGSTRSYGPGDM